MSDETFERGRAIRGEVIGRDWSEGALARAGAFDRPFQELALRYCWGEIWGREGLSRRDRSLVNLAALAAMGKPAELAVHVRGARATGLSWAEIQEVFLQICVYAGVPAAGEAFRVGREAFEAEGAEKV